MNNNDEHSNVSSKSISIDDNNKDSVDKYKEKAKSFTDKIVNKISHMDDMRRNEIVFDKSSNIRFITFGLFALIGFIVLIYAILVAVVSREGDSICKCVFCSHYIEYFYISRNTSIQNRSHEIGYYIINILQYSNL